MKLNEMLAERNLPKLDITEGNWDARKAELKNCILENEYGCFHMPESVTEFKVLKEQNNFAGNTAVYRTVEITTVFSEALPEGGDRFSFIIQAVIPKKEGKVPCFVHADYHDSSTSWLLPIEEIIARGYAYFSFSYREITEDLSAIPQTNVEYPAGILPFINMHAVENKAGTLLCWAWACMRTLDFALSCPEIDPERTAVVGHSRLGKASLLAGMIDERFQFVFANDSGCAGAGLYRGGKGENIKDAAAVFPYWFCNNYLNFERVPEALPFDQHFMIAACAPRYVYISGASDDVWADNDSMYLSCKAGSEAYEMLGLTGLVSPDRLPKADDVFVEGHIGFHITDGPHNMGRRDWNRFMDYMDQKRER